MRLTPGTRVLLRADRALQVGVREPVILEDLSADERRFVERLESVANVAPSDLARYSKVIDRLSAAGLVTPGSSELALPSKRVLINDGGPIGCAIGMALARAGWAVAIDDEGAALRAPRGTYDPGSLATTRQAAAAETIRRLLPNASVHAGRAVADIDVIVSHGAPLLEDAVPLMARDTPHVFVTTDERGAVIGPLVIPGRSACGTCVGIARTQTDSDWPLLSLQLIASRALPQTLPDVQAQVAGLVAGALTWWKAWGEGTCDPTITWFDAVWAIDHQRVARRESTIPQPECGCGAAGPVGDELAARRARMPRAPGSHATS